MEILDKIKKGLIGIAGYLLTMPTKVFGASLDIPLLYGPPSTPELYGVVRPSPAEKIWNFARFFIIPLALLIGIIVYFKKSKSSKKKKILITIGTILLTIIIYFVINEFIK